MTCCDARLRKPRTPLKGTHVLAAIPGRDVAEYFCEMVHAGMPHHVAVFAGNHTKTLKSLARLMKIRFVG